MYKYDMHVHSSGCSACSPDDVCQIISAAKEAGYAGLMLTNHFFGGNTCVNRSLPWNEFVNEYKLEYLKAKAFGEEIGMSIFFGIEEGVGSGKEALIYGIDPDTIAAHPELKHAGIERLSTFVHQNGGLIYAAHPFRQRFYIEDPLSLPNMDFYDGIEVYNSGNTPIDNEFAATFAEGTGCITIAGGDVHRGADFRCCGIATEKPIKTDSELIEVLKTKAYRLLINNEII